MEKPTTDPSSVSDETTGEQHASLRQNGSLARQQQRLDFALASILREDSLTPQKRVAVKYLEDSLSIEKLFDFKDIGKSVLFLGTCTLSDLFSMPFIPSLPP